MIELFGKTKGTISEHIKHSFEDSDLDENSVARFFQTVQSSQPESATLVADIAYTDFL